jgi:hypothetical protein
MALIKSVSQPKVICSVAYIYLSSVVAYQKYYSSSVVISTGGTGWKKLYATPASIDYSEKSGISNEGTAYSKELALFYPGNDQPAQDELSQLEARPLLVKFTYNDGKTKVIGNPWNPALLKLDFKSNDVTGFSAVFYNVSEERSLFYYGELSSVPLPEDEGSNLD